MRSRCITMLCPRFLRQLVHSSMSFIWHIVGYISCRAQENKCNKLPQNLKAIQVEKIGVQKIVILMLHVTYNINLHHNFLSGLLRHLMHQFMQLIYILYMIYELQMKKKNNSLKPENTKKYIFFLFFFFSFLQKNLVDPQKFLENVSGKRF